MLRRSTIPIINYCFVVPIYRTIIVFPWKSFRQPVRRLVPLCRSCAVHDANDGRRPDLAPRTAVLNFVSTGVCAWSLFLPHRPPYRIGSRATPRARPPVCRSRSAEKDGVSDGPTNKKKKKDYRNYKNEKTVQKPIVVRWRHTARADNFRFFHSTFVYTISVLTFENLIFRPFLTK